MNVSQKTKPEAKKIGWKLNKSQLIFKSKWYNLRQDNITLPNNEPATYTYIEHPGSAFIVPLTPDNKIILIRSYRYTIDEWCWEIPAGTLGDQSGISVEKVAEQELDEEIGAKYDELNFLGNFYLSNGFGNIKGHFFLAKGVVIERPQKLESTEIIDRISMFSVDQVVNMVKTGIINDADSAFAILLALTHF